MISSASVYSLVSADTTLIIQPPIDSLQVLIHRSDIDTSPSSEAVSESIQDDDIDIRIVAAGDTLNAKLKEDNESLSIFILSDRTSSDNSEKPNKFKRKLRLIVTGSDTWNFSDQSQAFTGDLPIYGNMSLHIGYDVSEYLNLFISGGSEQYPHFNILENRAGQFTAESIQTVEWLGVSLRLGADDLFFSKVSPSLLLSGGITQYGTIFKVFPSIAYTIESSFSIGLGYEFVGLGFDTQDETVLATKHGPGVMFSYIFGNQ
jgi:hypothetical protein